MLNKERLIEWCWENLRFDNDPETWEDTYIVDILNGYNGNCYDHNGKIWDYEIIRSKFTED